MGIFNLFKKEDKSSPKTPDLIGKPVEKTTTTTLNYYQLVHDIIKQNPPERKLIGNPNPICPYCSEPLKKMPGRKTICPSCGNPILVRTRASDKQKVLITEKQQRELIIQNQLADGFYDQKIEILIRTLNGYQTYTNKWRILAGDHHVDEPEHQELLNKYFIVGSKEEIQAIRLLCRPDCNCCPGSITGPKSTPDYDEMKKELQIRFKQIPSDGDVLWGLTNKKLIIAMQNENWGRYSQIQYELGELLVNEGRLRQALPFFLTSLYLNLNGASNRLPSPSLPPVQNFTPFDTKSGYISSLVTSSIIQIRDKERISPEDIKAQFIEIGNQTQHDLNAPLNGNQAWARVQESLK